MSERMSIIAIMDGKYLIDKVMVLDASERTGRESSMMSKSGINSMLGLTLPSRLPQL